MEYLANVSFDLSSVEGRANPTAQDYANVYADLETIGLYHKAVPEGGGTTTLTNTTCIGYYQRLEAPGLRDELAGAIKSLFRQRRVKGKFFVTVGRDWAWQCSIV